MTFALTSPITGAAQTGLTSPTYSLTADQGPTVNSKQSVVSALGGTQTGVAIHSIAVPFTIAMFKPSNPRVLGPVNPITGVLLKVPTNSFKVITRKGVIPLAGQAARNMVITTTIDVPAGADAADPASVRAALSAHIGALSQQSAGVGDSVTTGVL